MSGLIEALKDSGILPPFVGWVVWNLFLAAIPVAAGYLLAWGLGNPGRRRLPLTICLFIGMVWLAFLPNTCYLLTEWRHFLFDARWEEMRDSANSSRQAMLESAQWALLFLMYSGVGVLAFTLSIRPVERVLRSMGQNIFYYAPFFFFLMSLGVYLGLIVRLNSWDLVARPGLVLQSTLEALANPTLLLSILVFAGLLWAIYEAIDLWLDGVVAKWQR